MQGVVASRIKFIFCIKETNEYNIGLFETALPTSITE